ncbi:ABC transporter substrate-binding protein [Mycolicibacterium neoaurum]|uniref:ABC transporter substrate-binding protein n=1 Tax=Mycolicibacterium neoaurum TaxID=1795 RepID=UPI001423D7F8|nr:ABC transporter substrate-binding protein [Mycolicibacterium neoaurum]
MNVTTLDPLLAYQATDIRAVALLGARLFSYDQAGNVGPGLAQSSSVSTDGLSWTFTLRPDLKFSDGSPLTATDVAASLERARTDETNIYSAMTTPWKSVSALDPQTVRMDLNVPTPKLEAVLSYPFTTIVPAAHVDDTDYYKSPVSAGMFSLKSWDGGSDAEFVRNEYYWDRKPIVANVTMTGIPDPDTRLSQVRSGEVNFAPDIPPSLIDEVADPVKLVTTQLNGFYSLVPNNAVSPFDNYDVRKAISMAVDREQINDEVWQGKSQPLAGFWPPSMDGYANDVPAGRDLEGAQAALQDTLCEKGCTTELYYTSAYSGEAEMAAILKRNLADIGITVNTHDLDATTLYSRLAGGALPMAITLNWDYLNQPSGLLNYTLQQGASQANWSFYNSSQMNRLIDQANQQSGEQLADTLAKIDTLFRQDVPYVNLTPSPTFAAVNLPEDDLVVESTSATYDFERQ